MPSVLLVEDDPAIQRMYANGLRLGGHTVITASSGGEALARAGEATYDVIILDMLLTGMSGLDFLRQYDVKTKSPNTKVIALTNMENQSIKDKASELGITDYLIKSNIEPAALAAHVTQITNPSITPPTE